MTPECERLSLIARPVETDEHVEMLRQVRNLCRDGFAHDNREISQAAQTAWWIVMRGRVKAWLYWSEDGLIGDMVGYGLLRKTDDGRWWNSVAVMPQFTHQGYGGAITADLLTKHDGEVWAEARVDNVPAMRLHRMADWELLGFVDGRAQFRSRTKVVA